MRHVRVQLFFIIHNVKTCNIFYDDIVEYYYRYYLKKTLNFDYISLDSPGV